MSFYDGMPLLRGDVSLHVPDLDAVARAIASADLEENQWLPWHVRAAADDGIVYFSVSEHDRLVGQAMLHDIERDRRTGMVGYHIFRAEDRGRGVGTQALSLLTDHAFSSLGLYRLVAITGVGNVASQRIAEKCGFVAGGAPREGSHLVLYELSGERWQLTA